MVTLNSMFEETSQCYAKNIAVTFNSGIAKEHATYEELDIQASKVADFLGTLCKGQEIIGIYSKQSIGLVACILGILKCQSCFAPIDLNWPPQMICKFLLKLNISLVLVDNTLLEVFQKWKIHLPSDCKVELIRNQALDANGFSLVRTLFEVKGDIVNIDCLCLAYVMKTSGTTGESKAVKVPHTCIASNITDLRNVFQVTSDDVMFLASPYTFDPFIVQMFITFSAGARLVIVPDSIKMVPSKLCRVLFDEEMVTILQPTPSLMHHIGQDLIQAKVLSNGSSLRVLAFGGESCPTLSTLRQWRPPQSKTSMYNLYGITEVSCWASWYHIPDDALLMEGETGACHVNLSSEHEDLEDYLVDLVNDVPLGLPLLDTVMEVRDENGKLVQEGMGQIYIGGSDRVCLIGGETSLAAGTIRATGDWAYVKDRCIWFCGRRDRQIKRMGKRINLDWIERQITDKLESACSLVLEKTSNHSRLHLFVVDQSLSFNNKKLTSLKCDLLNLLPVDAQPDRVHVVSNLPMTAHGKIDRGSLLAGAQKTSKLGDMSTREFLERTWNEVLEVNEAKTAQNAFSSSSSEFVGKQPGNFHEINTNDFKADNMFIASGGSSLNAIRLADLIESFVTERKKTSVDLSELLDIILSKPFNALCKYVDSRLTGTDKREDLDAMEIHPGHIDVDSSGSDKLDATTDLRDSTKEERITTLTRENHVEDEEKMRADALPSKMKAQDRKCIGNNPKTKADEEENEDIVSSWQVPILPVKRKSLSLGDGVSLQDKKAARGNTIIQCSDQNDDLNEDELFGLSEMESCFCSVHRRNQSTVCKFCKYSTLNTTSHVQSKGQTFPSHQTYVQAVTSSLTGKIPHQALASLEHVKAPGTRVANQEMRNINISEENVSIICQWRTCLYKCIDASPFMVYAPGRSEGEVFIGSHGHVFMCIRLSDGKVRWESRVRDRIESSAALSLCGTFVIVGCYDGKVYVFNRLTGETIWTFQTGAAVKSSPCVDPQTGVAWVGSHDHHLYALDVTNKQCICAIDCGGGSCFSSPCISTELQVVFIATLTGRLLAVDAAEHTILWSQQCPKPVFASPLLTPTGVICACVDGFVYCFDFHGNKLWRYQTHASVFCSPTYIDAGYIVFGSHDRCVYCLSLNGELQWSFTTDGQVYSSPFVAELNACNTTCHTTCHTTCRDKRDAQIAAVFVLSTVGTLYVLDLYSGVLLASYSLPGEVFSSPVVVDNRVLIGCRNDYLYSLEISSTLK